MLFSSIPFLYYFLPLVLAVYFLTPGPLPEMQCSCWPALIFYAWGEPKYVLLMLASILSGYGFGLLQERYRGQRAKLVCGLSVARQPVLSPVLQVRRLLPGKLQRGHRTGVPLLRIALPIGISFYPSRSSAIRWMYTGASQLRKNLIHLAAYVSMFPQLIAGPIVRYSDIAQQLEHRSPPPALAAEGTALSHWIGEKILIANQLGELCSVFQRPMRSPCSFTGYTPSHLPCTFISTSPDTAIWPSA